ncbi:MAG: hypothetical protein AAF460_00700 [Pseudomonadota bacterium]
MAERQKTAWVGYALTGLVCFGALSVFVGEDLGRVFRALSGLCAWAAAARLWSTLSTALRVVATILVVAGVGAGVTAEMHPARFVEQALSQNVGILCMLLSVGFLRLVSLEHPNDRPARGFGGWWRTLFATAVFGAVINISALLIIADYTRARGGGDAFTLQSLTRVFTASAAWSPFFAGMAVVLSYVPGVSVIALMVSALPFAGAGIVLTWAYGRVARSAQLGDFVGFPLHPRALALPTCLALLVLAGVAVMPSVPIVIAIALAALVTCVGFLVRESGLRTALGRMGAHVTGGMASGRNELVLFLAAGVLSVGLGAAFDSGGVTLPEAVYTWQVASATLASMLALAVVGVHPIVTVSAMAPVLLSLSPPPLLIALTFLFVWSLGTSVSPMSATLLTVQGRYGLSSWRVALANAPFACVLYGVAVLSFVVVA